MIPDMYYRGALAVSTRTALVRSESLQVVYVPKYLLWRLGRGRSIIDTKTLSYGLYLTAIANTYFLQLFPVGVEVNTSSAASGRRGSLCLMCTATANGRLSHRLAAAARPCQSRIENQPEN